MNKETETPDEEPKEEKPKLVPYGQLVSLQLRQTDERILCQHKEVRVTSAMLKSSWIVSNYISTLPVSMNAKNRNIFWSESVDSLNKCRVVENGV